MEPEADKKQGRNKSQAKFKHKHNDFHENILPFSTFVIAQYKDIAQFG